MNVVCSWPFLAATRNHTDIRHVLSLAERVEKGIDIGILVI